MNTAGFQEVHFPALLPREPYEATGRWTEYGPNLFRLKDRRDNDFLLAPTHEEMFTLVVRDLFSSYRDLPLSIYQIQTKYRDEARPRAGLLRGREFVMKDSYSFDVDNEGLQASYDRHRDAYISTFDRLGLPYVIVSAMSGAMGGSASEEFLAPIDVGEDTFVQCTSCGYAANTEAVLVAETPAPSVKHPAATVVDTPNTPTIDSLVEHLNAAEATQRSGRPWAADDTLKNVVLNLVHPDGTVEPLAIGIPGNREVDLKRVEPQVAPAEPTPFTDADFEKYPSLVKGYIGPQALGVDSLSGIRYLVDPRVVNGTAWVTGANTAGHHITHLVCGRDFTADGSIEAAEVLEGDPCSQCGEPMSMARGIEIGHIFQLGRKYAEALDLKVLDADGKQVTVTMGSYGIGVSRAVAAIAESHHDEYGLCWPRAVAPADVHLVIAGKDDGPQRPAAETLAAEFEAAGIDVLFDDREGISPGVRFKDAELIGVPTIVVVGRGITEGLVEVKDRLTGERADMAIREVTAHITALLADA
jgi:prolyl-tRNA synthetase